MATKHTAQQTSRAAQQREIERLREEIADTLSKIESKLDVAQRLDEAGDAVRHRAKQFAASNPVATVATVACVAALAGVALWRIVKKLSNG